MSPEEQIEAFDTEVMRIIIQFAEEWTIPVASMVGVLEMCKQRVLDGGDLDFEADFDLM